MRRRSRTVLAVLPMALALTLAGCGSDGDEADDKVATVNGGKQPSGAAAPGANRDQMLRDWARCLRGQGLDVEDPKPGEGLQLQNGNEDEKARTDRAMESCRRYAPQEEATDKDRERADMLKMAQCMRRNGVEKFADPKPGQGIHVDPEVAGDPDFKTAQKKCDTRRPQTVGG